MQMVHPPIAASPDAYAVCRVLSPITIRIDASAESTCRALLAHAERTTELLLYTPVDARLIPGRWRATRQGLAHLVRYELVAGPLRGLTLGIRARDLDDERTQLQIEGTYMAPVKPLAARRRTQQFAEGLQAGLARSVRHALSPNANASTEQRATPRQALTLPVRLRVGDLPWPGVTRDVSAGGLGLMVSATPREAMAVAAHITGHTAGAVEVLLSDGRLTARVRIMRVQPWATGINVGLYFSTSDEGARLLSRLVALDLLPTSLEDSVH